MGLETVTDEVADEVWKLLLTHGAWGLGAASEVWTYLDLPSPELPI